MKKRWTLLGIIVVVIIVGVSGINYKIYKEKQAQEVNATVMFPKSEETISKMEGNIAVVNNANSILVLVNKSRRLPDHYKPQDLVIPNVRFLSEGNQEKKRCGKKRLRRWRKCFNKETRSGYFYLRLLDLDRLIGKRR